MKLGKLPHRRDVRTLQLVRYLDAGELPPAPASYKLPSQPSVWPMFLNDQIGDCAIAAPGHMIEGWSAAVGHEATVTDNDVLDAYERVSGYDPRTQTNDNGCVELDVLKFWRSTGISKNKIGAFAVLDPSVTPLVKDACYLFGGLYIGLDLPASAEDQLNAGQHWHTVAGRHTGKYAPGSWGGHAVNVIAYDRYGLTCITWGAPQKMTWGFWHAYCDEAWAIINPAWFAGGKSVAGFDVATLQADLAKIGHPV